MRETFALTTERKEHVAKRKWRDAEATLEDDTIVIRLRVKHIPNAMRQNPDCLFDGVKVTDLSEFTKDVVNALNDEAEDGTTPVHDLFDSAFDKAVNDGSLGVSIDEDNVNARPAR